VSKPYAESMSSSGNEFQTRPSDRQSKKPDGRMCWIDKKVGRCKLVSVCGTIESS